LASFLSVFPDAHLFCLWRSTDALLVAAPSGRALSLARLHSPALRRDLARARLEAPEQIAAFYVASGPALREMAAGGALNTDDRPFVEYRAPRDMIEVGRSYGSHHPGITRLLTLPVVPPVEGPLAGWPREVVLEWRARQRLSSPDRENAAAALAELRDAGLPALAARLAPGAGADPVKAARASLDVAGAMVAARSLLATATGASRLEPLLVLGVAEFGAAHEDAALAAFAEAQAVAPADPRAYALEARVRLARGDTDGARRALERGTAHAPGDSTLARGLRVLAGSRPPRPGDSP